LGHSFEPLGLPHLLVNHLQRRSIEDGGLEHIVDHCRGDAGLVSALFQDAFADDVKLPLMWI
jgi:hypothetical protein